MSRVTCFTAPVHTRTALAKPDAVKEYGKDLDYMKVKAHRESHTHAHTHTHTSVIGMEEQKGNGAEKH